MLKKAYREGDKIKGILEFNLPEENEEFKIVNHASKYYCSIWDMINSFRQKVKYAPDDTPKEVIEAHENIQRELYDILRDNEVLEDF